jgi:hypothetical protein
MAVGRIMREEKKKDNNAGGEFAQFKKKLSIVHWNKMLRLY